MSDTSSNGGPEGHGWVDLSDVKNNIEVVFTDIPAVYSNQKDVTVQFDFIQGWSNQGDIIGLFNESNSRIRVLPVDLAVNSVTFSTAGFPNDSSMLYKFIYVKADGQSCGASTYFKIKPTPPEVIDLSTEEAESEEEFLVIRTDLQVENEKLKKQAEQFIMTFYQMEQKLEIAKEKHEKDILRGESEFTRVQEELDVIVKEKADLMSQVALLKTKELGQTKHIMMLESTICEKDKKLDSDLKVILSYRSSIQKLSQDRNLDQVVSPATIEFFHKALEERRSMLKAVEASKVLLQEELEAQRLQNSILHPKFKELENTYKTLQMDLQQCEIKNKEKFHIIEDLQTVNKKLEDQLTQESNANAIRMKRWKMRYTELKQQMGENEKKFHIIEDLETVNKKLEDQLTQDSGENEARIEVLMMQCSELKQQMEENTVKESETIAQLEAKCSELEQQLKDTKKEDEEKFEQLTAKCSDFDKHLQSKVKEDAIFEQLVIKCSELEQQLEDEAKEVTAVETDAENLCCKENEKRIEDLKARLLEAGEIFKEQYKKIKQLKKDIKKLRTNQTTTQLPVRNSRYSVLQRMKQYKLAKTAAVYVSDDETMLRSPNAATTSPERVNDCDTGEPVEKVPSISSKEKEAFQSTSAQGQQGGNFWMNPEMFCSFSMSNGKSQNNDNVFPAKDNHSNEGTAVNSLTRKLFPDNFDNSFCPPKSETTNILNNECPGYRPSAPTVKQILSTQQKSGEKRTEGLGSVVLRQLYPSLKDLHTDFEDDLDDSKCPRYTTPSPPPLYQPTNDIFTNQEKVEDKVTSSIPLASYDHYTPPSFSDIASPSTDIKENTCPQYPAPPVSCLPPRDYGMSQKNNTSLIFTNNPTLFPSSGTVAAADIKNTTCLRYPAPPVSVSCLPPRGYGMSQKSNTSLIFTAPTMFPPPGPAAAADTKNTIWSKFVPQTPPPLIQLASNTLMNHRKLHGNVTSNSVPTASDLFSRQLCPPYAFRRVVPPTGTPATVDTKNRTWNGPSPLSPVNFGRGTQMTPVSSVEETKHSMRLPAKCFRRSIVHDWEGWRSTDHWNTWTHNSPSDLNELPVQQLESFYHNFAYPSRCVAQKPIGLKSTSSPAASDEMKNGWIPIGHPHAAQKPIGLKSSTAAASDEMKNRWSPISHPHAAQKPIGLKSCEANDEMKNGWIPIIGHPHPAQKPIGVKSSEANDETKNGWKASMHPQDVYHPKCCPTCGHEVFVCKNDQSGMIDHLEIIHHQTLCPVCNGLFEMYPGKYFKRHVESHFN